MSPRIITTFVHPPIPIRTCDWSAHYAGEEDECMAIGRGETETQAVLDLIENHPRPEVLCADGSAAADAVLTREACRLLAAKASNLEITTSLYDQGFRSADLSRVAPLIVRRIRERGNA